MDEITLSQLIKELQTLEAEHGLEKVLSIGSCSGRFVGGMSSPFTINLLRIKTGKPLRAYVPTKEKDIGKTCVD